MYAIRTAWQEETVLKTKRRWLRCNVWSSYIGMPTLCGRTYFFERGEENSQYCVWVATPTSFVSLHIFPTSFCWNPHFLQRVFSWTLCFSVDEPIERNFPHHLFKKSHVVDTTQVRANCVQNENSETHALCASCVWIATSRCNPNNSKLREQYSPRSLFDVTF